MRQTIVQTSLRWPLAMGLTERVVPVSGGGQQGPGTGLAAPTGRARIVHPRPPRHDWPDHEPSRVVRGIAAGLVAAGVFWALLGLLVWHWVG